MHFRPITFVIACALIATASFQLAEAQEIQWLRSAKQAAKEAAQSGKPILIYVRSANCHYCDLMQKNVWQDKQARALVERNFIPLKLTQEENKEAVAAMKVKGFPATLIFSADRKYMGRIDGYVSPEEFMGTITGVQTASTAAPGVSR